MENSLAELGISLREYIPFLHLLFFIRNLLCIILYNHLPTKIPILILKYRVNLLDNLLTNLLDFHGRLLLDF